MSFLTAKNSMILCNSEYLWHVISNYEMHFYSEETKIKIIARKSIQSKSSFLCKLTKIKILFKGSEKIGLSVCNSFSFSRHFASVH